MRDATARQFDVDKNSVEMNQKTGAITFFAKKGRSIYLEKLFANLQATRMNGPTNNHLISLIVTATGEVALADNELVLKVAGTKQRFVLEDDPKVVPGKGEKTVIGRLKEALADGKIAVEVTGRVRGWEGRFTGFMKALPDASVEDSDKPAVFKPRLLVSDFKLLQLAAGTASNDKGFTNSIGMKFVLIPEGKFKMGSPTEEKDRDADEEQHEVAITRPFYLGIYTVTQREYQQVIGKNPSWYNASRGGGTDHPVDQVDWDVAVSFCAKLSNLPAERKAGRTYRLPTEAEWEYACRAGTTTAYNVGKGLSSKQANFNGNFPGGKADKGPHLGKPAKVGSYAPNAWGLYDMHGNVWQWCSDWYDPDYYKNSPGEDPKGPAKGVLPSGFDKQFFRVARGGCWLDEGPACRSAYRFRFTPDWPNRLIGFRVVGIVK